MSNPAEQAGAEREWTPWTAVPANDGPDVDKGDWQIWRGQSTDGHTWNGRAEEMFGFSTKDEMEDLRDYVNALEADRARLRTAEAVLRKLTESNGADYAAWQEAKRIAAALTQEEAQ